MLHNSQPKISITAIHTHFCSWICSLLIPSSTIAISVCLTHMTAISWKVCWGPFGVGGTQLVWGSLILAACGLSYPANLTGFDLFAGTELIQFLFLSLLVLHLLCSIGQSKSQGTAQIMERGYQVRVCKGIVTWKPLPVAINRNKLLWETFRNLKCWTFDFGGINCFAGD